MKLLLGIAACALAACATQPDAGLAAADVRAGARITASAPDPGTTLRIGVEFLPPELEQAPALVEPVRTLRREAAPKPRTTLAERARVPEARHTWALSAEDLADIDNPLERATLQFVSDLVREDERRTQREVRLPFLDWQPTETDVGPRLWSEQATAEAQAEWLSENGASLLSKPARRMLRRIPLVSDVELSIDEFRSSCVPMTEPYRQRHARERKLGRLSLRVHASDREDPVEVVYVRSGFRVGSSQEIGKLSIDLQLTERLSLTLRTRRDWHTSQHVSRADLAYRLSDSSSLRLAAGDDMEFLSTSSAYSMFEAPMDGSPGLVLYAVHIF